MQNFKTEKFHQFIRCNALIESRAFEFLFTELTPWYELFLCFIYFLPLQSFPNIEPSLINILTTPLH